jgi:hypothetical protein
MHGLLTHSYVADPIEVKSLSAAVDGRIYKRLSKSEKAALAVDLMRGHATLRPTLAVISKALGISVTYIEAAAHLSPDQLRQVRDGALTISEVLSTSVNAEPITPNDIVAWFRDASDGERAAVVAEVGVMPVWDAIAMNLD